jgi:GT2 family glycosyltransferase
VAQIDISLVTYNSAHWLDSFFKSLLNQAYPLELINLIICDNGSSDSTRDRLPKFQDEHAWKFASFQVFNGANSGFGVSHNKNIALGKSDYILAANPDLEFESDSIVNIVNAALADSDDAASWELRQKPYEHPKIYNPLTFETPWSSAACILYRRSAFEKVGGFEQRIFLYGEDVELSFRFRVAGFKLKYCPRAICWHYSYKEAGELKPQQFFGSVLSNMYIRMRYGGLRCIMLGFLLYFNLFRKPIPVPNKNKMLLKNLWKIIKDAPYFLKHRKEVIPFPALSFDYSLTRDGAFYELKKLEQAPLASIIIRTYGERQEFLKEAVTSVINQTYPNIELVVVEDGTSENADFINLIKGKLHKVVYAPIDKGGRCVAGNKGLELATGEYIGFLDDDDLLYADHVETLISAFISHPNFYAVYGNSYRVMTKIESLSPLSYKEIGLEHHLLNQHIFSRAKMWIDNYIPIQAVIFKRELYEQCGGFDVELAYLEDWNLWTRYSLKHDFMYVPKTTSLYRIPSDQREKRNRHNAILKYKSIALAKQKEMFLDMLTLVDIKNYAEQLSQPSEAKASLLMRAKNKIKRIIVSQF